MLQWIFVKKYPCLWETICWYQISLSTTSWTLITTLTLCMSLFIIPLVAVLDGSMPRWSQEIVQKKVDCLNLWFDSEFPRVSSCKISLFIGFEAVLASYQCNWILLDSVQWSSTRNCATRNWFAITCVLVNWNSIKNTKPKFYFPPIFAFNHSGIPVSSIPLSFRTSRSF